MLTLFSMPKPFRGHIGVIQRNAVGSWTRLSPACEVFLFGDEEGTADAAKQAGARHLPKVQRSEHGTPLVSDLFAQAEAHAKHEWLCYVNGDIILMDEFLRAVERVRRCGKPALVVSHRWDLGITEPLDFGAGWQQRLRERAHAEGTRQRDWYIDLFCFPKGLWGTIPDFAVGRAGWDNWMLYRARELGAMLVDVTPSATIVHQNHDYAHHPQGQYGVYEGPEAQRNIELAGGKEHLFSLKDATYELTGHGVRRALDPDRFRRYLSRVPTLRPGRAGLARLTTRYLRAPARWLCQALDFVTYKRV